MSSRAVEGIGISFSHHQNNKRLPVFENVDISVAPNERVAIVGSSGSGKSTPLSILSGQLAPDAGTVNLAGQSLAALDESERAKLRLQHVGTIYQDFRLLPRLTALQNVVVPLALLGNNRSHSRQEAEKALNAVGLGHRTDHRPNQLSGGEQQRVAIARAIVASPDVIFADEPTGSLDNESRDQILELLANLPRNPAILVVTHDDFVASWAHRTLELTQHHLSAHT
jgi:predicted ABC-type transport system involved in lysophospholipase L1 biosynthesis ATPase subunit